MAPNSEQWQPARLFPITGIGGAGEQERRATSALLAVVTSVHEFGRSITTRIGAPAGPVRETFLEVPFHLDSHGCRPDGLIRVKRGASEWVALVEVKTNHRRLEAGQIISYLNIARQHKFDAVLTVSQEIPAIPGQHPLALPKNALGSVQLHHLSWAQIHTDARIQEKAHAISDPDQAWILSEFVRYLRNPKSGALDLDGMGPGWVTLRSGAIAGTLTAANPSVVEGVTRFNQLVAFAGMELGRNLHVPVLPYLLKRDLENPSRYLGEQAAELAKSGLLRGSIRVPAAAAPLNIVADLHARRVECSITVEAPSAGRASTRVNWLLRQMQSAPDRVVVRPRIAWVKDRDVQPRTLKDLRADPKGLSADNKADIKSFTVTLGQPMGPANGVGAGSFIDSVLKLTGIFYADVVEHLRPWVASAPKLATGASEPESESDEFPVVPPFVEEPFAVQEDGTLAGLQGGPQDIAAAM